MGCCQIKLSKKPEILRLSDLDFELRTRILKKNIPEEESHSISSRLETEAIEWFYSECTREIIISKRPMERTEFELFFRVKLAEALQIYRTSFKTDLAENIPYNYIHHGALNIKETCDSSFKYFEYHNQLQSFEAYNELKKELIVYDLLKEKRSKGNIIQQYDSKAKGFFKAHGKQELLNVIDYYYSHPQNRNANTLLMLKAQALVHRMNLRHKREEVKKWKREMKNQESIINSQIFKIREVPQDLEKESICLEDVEIHEKETLPNQYQGSGKFESTISSVPAPSPAKLQEELSSSYRICHVEDSEESISSKRQIETDYLENTPLKENSSVRNEELIKQPCDQPSSPEKAKEETQPRSSFIDELKSKLREREMKLSEIESDLPDSSQLKGKLKFYDSGEVQDESSSHYSSSDDDYS